MSYEGGVDFILAVYDTDSSSYKDVGGQRNTDFGRENGTAEVTNKSSAGNREYIYTNSGWNLELDSVVNLTDDGFSLLDDACEDKAEVQARLTYPNGTTKIGTCLITKFDLSTPHDGEATAKMSLIGTGALTTA